MKRFYLFIRELSIIAALVMATVVVINMGAFQYKYTQRYSDTYEAVQREHDRQMVVGRCLMSNHSWEKSALALKQAYYDERAAHINTARKEYQLRMQTYMFFKLLDKKHPGVKKEILEDMGVKTGMPDSLFSGEPTPAIKDN